MTRDKEIVIRKFFKSKLGKVPHLKRTVSSMEKELNQLGYSVFKTGDGYIVR